MNVYVQPRASRTEVAGYHGSDLKIRLAAPPVDNAANEELTIFIAQQLGVPKRNVRVVSGAKSRRKTLEIIDAPEGAIASLSAPDSAGFKHSPR